MPPRLSPPGWFRARQAHSWSPVISLIQLGVHGPARTKAIAYYSLVLALGVAAGQILGGLFVSADVWGLGWPPIFLVNLPGGLVMYSTKRRAPSPTTP